jgi:hypothetical protein
MLDSLYTSMSEEDRIDSQVHEPEQIMQTGGRRRRRSRSRSRSRSAGKKHPKMVGSRAEVWHGTAHHTTGGLKKADLMKNKRGELVSRKKHAMGQKMYKKNPVLKEMSKKMKSKWSKKRSTSRKRKSTHKRKSSHRKSTHKRKTRHTRSKSRRRSSSRRRKKAKRRPSLPLFFNF